MWCRVVSGAESKAARPISWESAGSARAALGSAVLPLYTDPDARPGRQNEELAAEAYQSGLRAGEEAAAEKMSDLLNAKLRQLEMSIEQLALHRARIQREAEPELVKLSLAIARRILRRELTVDPESLLGLLKAGLEKIDASETHRVRVHPEHAALLGKLLGDAARPVEVISDTTLAVGAVVFETSRGALDTGLETQLREIERGFADIYPR